MANKRLGAVASAGSGWAVVLDEAKQLRRGDSGKTFYLDAVVGGSAFVVNLPQLSSSIAGWSATFITRQSNDAAGDIEILPYGVPSGGGSGTDENTCYVTQFASSEAADQNGSGQDGIKFDVSTSIANDHATVCTDGTNWFIHMFVHDKNHSVLVAS